MVSFKTRVLLSQLLLVLLSSLTYTSMGGAKTTSKKYVAVEGIVYCKSCKLAGYNKELDASPLQGAVVKLKCNMTMTMTSNYSRPYEQLKKTDKNGYFFIQASTKVSSMDVKRCKVYLVSSPLAKCKRPTNFNGGITGASLVYESTVTIGKLAYNLYTSGLLMFGPTYSTSCPKL